MVAFSTDLDWQHTPRHTARGIVIHDGKILLMERWRPGLHYFSIPGGGIEASESPEECVVRELAEETTIEVRVDRLVLIMQDGSITHKVYLCEYTSGEPELPSHAPEALDSSEDNKFKPGWQLISELPEIPFTYWEPLKQPLIDGIKTNFASGPVTVTINS